MTSNLKDDWYQKVYESDDRWENGKYQNMTHILPQMSILSAVSFICVVYRIGFQCVM